MALRIAILILVVGAVAFLLVSLLGDGSEQPEPATEGATPPSRVEQGNLSGTKSLPLEPQSPPAKKPAEDESPPPVAPEARTSESDPAKSSGDAELAISGRVTGPLGRALDQMTVIARSESDPKVWHKAKSASDGAYRIGPLPQGLYKVHVQYLSRIHWFAELRWFKPNTPEESTPFPTPKRTGVRAGSTGVDFRVRLPSAVLGQVVADDTGKPVPHMGLRISNEKGHWRSFNVSHPDGRFILAFPAAVSFSLVAKGGGYGESAPISVALAPGEIRQGVVIKLKQGGVLTGRIVHASGKPVRFASVAVKDAKTHAYLGSWSGLLPEDGRYRVKGLPTARTRVSVRTVDYLPVEIADVDVSETGEVVRSITVHDGGKIQVTVRTSDDKPVEGAVIRIKNLTTGKTISDRMTYSVEEKSLTVDAVTELRTDAMGAYKYSPLPAGAHELHCTYRGVKLEPVTVGIRVGRTTYYTFALPPGGD